MFGFIHLALPCRHLCARFQADHVHFFCTRAQSHARRIKCGLQTLGIVILFGKINLLMHKADSCAGYIDGHVATTHNNHPLAQFDLESEIDVDQEVDAVIDACQVRPGNVEFTAFV